MEAINLIRQNFRDYIFANVLFYGLVIVSMVFSYTQPSIQEELHELVRTGFLEVFPMLVEA